jgi:hypothetical protein
MTGTRTGHDAPVDSIISQRLLRIKPTFDGITDGRSDDQRTPAESLRAPDFGARIT